MPRITYVNGSYVPHPFANTHVEDRGYQFGDGVYEVIPVKKGVLIDTDLHLDRLMRSLQEIDLPFDIRAVTLLGVCKRILAENLVHNGIIYIQVTRGVAPRDHRFPKGVPPCVVISGREIAPVSSTVLEQGIKVVTRPDIRWSRCDIKSISLLANVLAKQEAVAADAYETWLVNSKGKITEGSATNAWIVTQEDTILTHPQDRSILGGITRAMLIQFINKLGYSLEERAFSPEEAYQAKEAFISSSSSTLIPVTQIDAHRLGNGHVGEISQTLRQAYQDHIEEIYQRKLQSKSRFDVWRL